MKIPPEVADLGATNNSFVGEILEFGSRYVDSSLRKLRLNAFTAINKIPITCPRTKVAVLKRAYRKPPSHGWCPSPEAAWGKFGSGEIVKFEHYLHYWHAVCKDAVASAVGHEQVLGFVTNVDVAAAEAFITSKEAKRTQSMIEATFKYVQQVEEKLSQKLPAATGLSGGWINEFIGKSRDDASKPEPPNKKDKVVVTTPLRPKVVSFDEATGTITSGPQGTRTEEDKTKGESEKVTLDFKMWFKMDLAKSMGSMEADHGTAVAALRMLHTEIKWENLPLRYDFDVDKKEVHVILTKDVAKHELFMPPCVPRVSKLVEVSTHKNRARIRVMTLRKMQDDSSSSPSAAEKTAVAEKKDSRLINERVFYAQSDYKLPVLVDDPDRPGEKIWRWAEDTEVHPFWAIRRVTSDKMKELQNKVPGARFNCELTARLFSVCCVGAVSGDSLSISRQVEVQFATNSVDLAKGDELFFEVAKEAKRSKEIDWKEDAAKRARAEKAEAGKQAAAARRPAKQPAGKGGIKEV